MKFYDKNGNEHDTQIGALFAKVKNKFAKNEEELVIYDVDKDDENIEGNDDNVWVITADFGNRSMKIVNESGVEIVHADAIVYPPNTISNAFNQLSEAFNKFAKEV